MTISLSDNDPRISYTVNSGVTQTTFTVPFEFFDLDDLRVYVDGTLKTKTTHYTLASGGSGATGSITMSVTGATGNSTVIITRSIALQRTTDFQTSGPFAVASLNTELDKIIAIQADLKDDIDRSLRLSDFDTDIDLSLPDIDTRKGKTLAFNASTGVPEAGPSISDVQTVSAAAADIASLADIEDGTTATDAISGVAAIASNVSTVAGIASNVTAVAGNTSNINAVAGDATDIGTVAGLATKIGRLGTADAVADMALLGTADVVSDLNTLATSAIVNDLDALSNIATELDALGDITSNITTVAGISSNVTTVAGDSADIQSVAGNATNLNTVAGSISNVNNVGGSIANVNTVASNITGVNSFGERYRVGSSDPTSSLDQGDLFFTTTSNQYKFCDGAAWQTVNVTGLGNLSEDNSPQLGGDLQSNGNDIDFADNDKAIFGAGNDLEIFHNGTNSKIASATGDLIISTAGTESIFLTDAGGNNLAQFNDNSDVKLYHNANEKLATKSDGVDITGELQADSLDIDGNGTIDGSLTITTADNNPQLILTSTDDDATSGPKFELIRNSASPAQSDSIGAVVFKGTNNAAETLTYAKIDSIIQDVADGSEDAQIRLIVRSNGILREALGLNATDVVVNEGGTSRDFRVESNGSAHALFVNGGNDRVGILNSSPATALDVTGTVTATAFAGDGSALTGLSGAVSNTPVVSAIKGSDQTISRNTWTKITGFTSSEYDSDSAWNGSRFTVPSGKGGRYLCIANLRFTFASAGNDGEQVIGAFYINGGQRTHFTQLRMMSHRSIGLYAGTGSIIQNLSAGDYVEVYGYMQDDSSSGSLKIDGQNSTGSRVGFMRID